MHMRNSAVVLTDSEDDRSAMDVDVDVESRRELGSGEASLPWVEKYRPEELSGLVSQENIVSTVSRLLESNRLPHLLFYGPAGTGKTTAALAIAKKLNGAKFQSMTLELNASDQRGIAVVRDRIKTFASTQQIFQSGCKFVILDEADAMTSAAQFSLRRSNYFSYSLKFQGINLSLHLSYGKVHKEYSILHNLQLCEQNYPGSSIPMHEV